MFYSHDEATMLRNIETGQFHVAEIEDDRYTTLLQCYPSKWHNQIKEAFRFGDEDMISQLQDYFMRSTVTTSFKVAN
jgi:hypothetical protein